MIFTMYHCTNLYKSRLDREYPHNYQAFSIDESIRQQNEYKKLLENIRKLKDTKTYEIKMDDFIEA